MEIKWLGHSCFKISSKNESIVIDPYNDDSIPGLKPIREEANLALATHSHGDHCGIQNVVIKAPNTVFSIKEYNSYHDDAKGAKRGLNKIYMISDGEYRVVHMGDIGCIPDENIINEIKKTDVLLIPVGGFFTIDYLQAIQIISMINPKIVIPMHYRGANFGYDVIDKIDNFIEAIDEVFETDDSTIEINKNTEPGVYIPAPANN